MEDNTIWSCRYRFAIEHDTSIEPQLAVTHSSTFIRGAFVTRRLKKISTFEKVLDYEYSISVEPHKTHNPRLIAQAMGYAGLLVIRLRLCIVSTRATIQID